MLNIKKQFSTKAELVYQSLVDAIIGNILPPGTRLVVKEVAELLSVSDIPVREALKMLESTGLIETKSYIGSTIVTPSPEWLEEVFVMRSALEGAAVRSAVPYLSPSDILQISDLKDAMEKAFSDMNTTEYSALNRKFHHAIMSKSPYPNLLSMIDDIHIKSQYGRAIFRLKPDTLKTSNDEHSQLLQALRNQDVAMAEEITREHCLRVGSDLVNAIREKQIEDHKQLTLAIQNKETIAAHTKKSRGRSLSQNSLIDLIQKRASTTDESNLPEVKETPTVQ